jgi:hypothetical protein
MFGRTIPVRRGRLSLALWTARPLYANAKGLIMEQLCLLPGLGLLPDLDLRKPKVVGLKTGLYQSGKGILGGEHLIAAGALVRVQSQTIAIP